ncbi:MAG TPA: hypothetical protein DCQ98_12640 [Planctomycetaceae bacterium]|nr:hypothetical protein [Planctomycetaceae bacterium]
MAVGLLLVARAKVGDFGRGLGGARDRGSESTRCGIDKERDRLVIGVDRFSRDRKLYREC